MPTEEEVKPGDTLLSVEQVAKKLGVSTAWVRAHANGTRRPLLESAKLGAFRRFRQEHLETFIRQCEAIAKDQAARRKNS